jgi:hypothetical protein
MTFKHSLGESQSPQLIADKVQQEHKRKTRDVAKYLKSAGSYPTATISSKESKKCDPNQSLRSVISTKERGHSSQTQESRHQFTLQLPPELILCVLSSASLTCFRDSSSRFRECHSKAVAPKDAQEGGKSSTGGRLIQDLVGGGEEKYLEAKLKNPLQDQADVQRVHSGLLYSHLSSTEL